MKSHQTDRPGGKQEGNRGAFHNCFVLAFELSVKVIFYGLDVNFFNF